MSTALRILAAGCEGPLWRRLLDCWGRRPDRVSDASAGLARLAAGSYCLFVVSAGAEDLPALVARARTLAPRTAVVALSSGADAALGVRLAQSGLVDLIGPPRDDDEFFSRSVQRLEEALSGASDGGGSRGSETADPFDAVIGRSPAIREAIEVLRLIAPRRSTVLIQGATGSGKEVAARAVHAASPRAAGPFVEVNCAAIPEDLFESELFGHVKGSFTGAVASRAGSFEQADRGTLFLDEVGELPLEVQPKLLRALQEREVRRVGGKEAVAVDVRIIAATNRDLERMAAEGSFREDLYYRLAVVPARMPPLAERLEDVPLLVEYFLRRFIEREELPRKRIADAAMERLSSYHWPGNVRQLENTVEKAGVLSGERTLLTPSDFALPLPSRRETDAARPETPLLTAAGLDYERVVASFERDLIRQALELTGGNKKRAADLLRMKRTTLNARWKALDERWG